MNPAKIRFRVPLFPHPTAISEALNYAMIFEEMPVHRSVSQI
jgi:hypothetical protein